MADGAIANLGVQRNEDFAPHTMTFTDKASGSAIDLTGWSFAFRINTATGLGGSPELALSGTANGNGSYVQLLEASAGQVVLYIAKEDIAALTGSDRDIVAHAFNLIGTDNAGVEHVLARGSFIVEPGV